MGKKKRPPVVVPRWTEYCPVCLCLGVVRGVCPRRIRRSGRIYYWACDQCIYHYSLIRADSVPPAARAVPEEGRHDTDPV